MALHAAKDDSSTPGGPPGNAPYNSSRNLDRATLIKNIARRKMQQRVAVILLRAAVLVSVVTTFGLVVMLVWESLGFFQRISLTEFFGSITWTPRASEEYRSFGVIPLITGTLLVTTIATLVAVVFGLSAAIFLSEYAHPRVRKVLKPIIEILAGIPTVVYGYFALLFVTPLLQGLFGGQAVSVFNALSAGLVMGIMIMPMVTSLSEDAMYAVPRSLRDASYALGATKFETAQRVVVPAAASGIMSAFILGISRAVGETMIVTIAAGARPIFTLNPLEAIQTMTAYIVNVSQGETPRGTLDYQTLFAVGLLLFLMTLLMNILGRFVVARKGMQVQ